MSESPPEKKPKRLTEEQEEKKFSSFLETFSGKIKHRAEKIAEAKLMRDILEKSKSPERTDAGAATLPKFDKALN